MCILGQVYIYSIDFTLHVILMHERILAFTEIFIWNFIVIRDRETFWIFSEFIL